MKRAISYALVNSMYGYEVLHVTSINCGQVHGRQGTNGAPTHVRERDVIHVFTLDQEELANGAKDRAAIARRRFKHGVDLARLSYEAAQRFADEQVLLAAKGLPVAEDFPK